MAFSIHLNYQCSICDKSLLFVTSPRALRANLHFSHLYRNMQYVAVGVVVREKSAVKFAYAQLSMLKYKTSFVNKSFYTLQKEELLIASIHLRPSRLIPANVQDEHPHE